MKRFTRSRTFMNPLQFGPTIAMGPAASTSRDWSARPSSPISAKPPAATATPPHPSDAASCTTTIERSALTSDSTASTGRESALRLGTVGRS